MRRWLALAMGLVVLAVANYAIFSREQLLKDGQVVLLELAPVDPRSLMQGDYMALRFKVAEEAFLRGKRVEVNDGHVVLALNERGVGKFLRLDNGTPLAKGEVRMRYRLRDGNPKFATNAFFFQEGDAKIYEPARYGEFRVDGSGDSILTGMRGEDFALLGPVKR